MSQWYQSSITRDEAVNIVKGMKPGAFIVRDSQTVHGGYALTIKVPKDLIRERRKLNSGKEGVQGHAPQSLFSVDVRITDDMCVTHFLIQPTSGGIKLQGWNECSFRT